MIATKRRLKVLARRKALQARRASGELPHGVLYARHQRMKILEGERQPNKPGRNQDSATNDERDARRPERFVRGNGTDE